MNKISPYLILYFVTVLTATLAQSPHGAKLTIDCAICHQADSWTYNGIRSSFSHDSTSFPLYGQHIDLDCRSCHIELVFEKASSNCISCHNDIHKQSVGNDCARCHNSVSWIVENITQLHEETAFPLIGVHRTMDCAACHQDETNLRFNVAGVDCISCHRVDFLNTTKPNHLKLNFGEDCSSCHNLNGSDWNTTEVDHTFFPLEKGHASLACNQCHGETQWGSLSSDCFSCHENDFNATILPNHKTTGFSTRCMECHTLDPGWKPAQFTSHDSDHFPIYSGSHQGVWSNCIECHTNTNDFKEFTCINCHQNPETDNIHVGIGGYTYSDKSCLGCHPAGNADDAFDHNSTSFPLTGAHITTNCIECHANGFEGTSTACVDCHLTHYNQSVNPNHSTVGISTDCASCHNTAPGWSPATFDIHDQFYTLNGAHKTIYNQCNQCHGGNYNNTPNTCAGCHTPDFTEAKNPDHVLNQFSNECTICHDETAWRPSTFNHDALYFPIYTGKHAGAWDQCTDCHLIAGDFKSFSCVSCHTDPVTSDVHVGIQGYIFQDNACLACHPTGDANVTFDHNTTAFPLTGAHLTATCFECHSNGYAGTPTECVACHSSDRNQAINPNHLTLSLGDDCAKCHSTQPGWAPASFPDHNNYYALNGAHLIIANNCFSCHQGDYQTTETTCFGCHSGDFGATLQPDHELLGFSTDCISCHNETAWAPSTFEHDALYFPIFSGKHKDRWNNCTECHQNQGNFAQFTCTSCHQNPQTNNEHAGVPGYIYNSDACLACHPTGDADIIFDHNATAFPLTGAHISTSCIECHSNGFSGTPTNCSGCHQADFTASQNPNHTALQLSTECATCHTTTPGWAPASFAVHNLYYTLNGAHAAIADQCTDCHQGNYNNTPNTCVGCHLNDYNATQDPNHLQLQFPNQCNSCHNENAWIPSTFNHDDLYFPIYSGSHQGTWNECQNCHTNPGNYAVFTCISCHQNPETNEEHQGVSGYFYQSNACLACHPTGDADIIFDHNATGFALTEGHAGVDCIECHSNGFEGTSNVCNTCHMNSYNQSNNPNHPSLSLSTDCISCHTTQPSWAPATFDVHDNFFVLEGAHALISTNCAECHNGNYNNTPNTCIGCHEDSYNATTDPDHEILQYPTDCFTCHSQSSWTPASFNHDLFYPLTGAHITISNNCIVCHANGYTNTPNTCNGCHQNDFNTSLNPNHNALGFSNDCIVCHTTAPGWQPASMPDHDTYFMITGAHLAIENDCAACHNGDYNNTPNTCVGCHLDSYNGTSDPDHEVQQFPTDCASCHSQNAWTPSTFDHSIFYPLVGAHAGIANDCYTCHNGNYDNTPNTCIGCHLNDFNSTSDPDHEVQQFPENCTLCHSQTSWVPATFDHNQYYPLTGGHQLIEQQCALCHQGGYNNTPNTCIGCHQSDYNNSANPNHTSLNLSNDCTSCHTTVQGWTPALFPDHNNYYPIQGAHMPLNCIDCHQGNYNNTPNTCIGCHQNDYSGALIPNHAANQYPTDCTICHSQNGWSPSTFDHNSFYPLTGAHVPVASECNLCHNGGYNNTPNTCAGCHQSDYNGTVNPNHNALNISTDCVSCHTTEPGWNPALFPDHDNYWVITGAHTSLGCVECHNNNYNNTPNTCYGCHLDDYNNTNNPDHQTAQFPTNCMDCHSQNAWIPATFDHDGMYFPIYSGKHDGEWNACSDCHTNSNNYSIFSCLGCHPHNNQSETNNDHEGVNGYQYLSSACYACHPNGED